VADGGFDVAISFKLRGKELVPRCVNGVGKAARTCAAAPFPEIDLSEAKVLGRLTPHVTNGNLAFKLRDLHLALDVRVPVCDNVFGAWTCTIADVEGLKRRKREEVRKLIADLFAKNRDAIARTVSRAVLRDFVSVQHVRLDAQGLAISGRLRIQAGLAGE
jgi:hypothetical protein